MTLAYTKNGKKVQLTYTSQGILITAYRQKKNTISPICLVSIKEFSELLKKGELFDKFAYARLNKIE